MIGLLRAFAILRFRLLVNGIRGPRRDNFEQVSRITRLFVAAFIAVSLIPGSAVLAILAFIGGKGLALGHEKALAVTTGARGVLAVVVIVVAISPILKFGGAAASATRLALLPVPRGLLFFVELAAQLADPWILAVLPGLLALPAGLLAGGDPGRAFWAMAAGFGALVVLAATGAAASLLGALVFRDRRLGELATIVLLLGITVAAYAPAASSRGVFSSLPRELKAQDHPWLLATPWELYAAAVEDSAQTSGGAPVVPLAGLALTALVLGGTARWAFGRLLNAPGNRRISAKRSGLGVRRLPGLSPAASAVARTFFRLVTRSVRGRVILYTAPLPAFLLAFAWRGETTEWIDPAYTGVLVLSVAGLLALMSMTSFLSDQFAVDRAGLTLTFLGPTSGVEIVAGKAIGGMGAFAIPLAIGTIVAGALHPRGSLLLWLGALTCVFAAYLAQSPISATLSAWFPAPFDLTRLRAGNPHPLASIVSLMASVLAFCVCGGLFAAVIALTASPWAGCAAAASIFGAAALAARFSWRLAARALDALRENLALVAQGR